MPHPPSLGGVSRAPSRFFCCPLHEAHVLVLAAAAADMWFSLVFAAFVVSRNVFFCV